MGSAWTDLLATGLAFARTASKVPCVSSAPTPTDTDPGVTEPACVFMGHVTTDWTAMEPACQGHAEKAQLGGSVTSRHQPVGPMCNFVTFMPPVNTAIRQPAVSAMRAMKEMEFCVLRRTLAWD